MYTTIANLGNMDKNPILLQHDPEEKMPWRLEVDGGNGKYFSEYEFALAWTVIARYNAKHHRNKLPVGRTKV